MENRQLIRAFIVDDDLNAMALLKRLLADYSVAIVGTAHDATPETLNEICEHNPDLLFLDVELPSMLGLDFCLQLREQVSSDMKLVVDGTKAYKEGIDQVGKSIAALNTVYELQLQSVNAQTEAQKAAAAAAKEAAEAQTAFAAGAKKLQSQVAGLNDIYGNMLNALA